MLGAPRRLLEAILRGLASSGDEQDSLAIYRSLEYPRETSESLRAQLRRDGDRAA